MRVKNLCQDDAAVSSTLGIVLLITLTVILTAIVGSFAFGLFGTQVAPNTGFNYDFTDGGDNVTVTHDGGDSLDADQLRFGNGWGSDTDNECQFVSGEVEAGDPVIDRGGAAPGESCAHGAAAGTDLSLVWQADDGKTFVIDERDRSG